MGLAYFVFPGATHTRFAHSLGVLHIVSQMLESIERNYKKKYPKKNTSLFNQEQKQKIRLAALLHDIGHLPLSHAMEHPMQRIIKEKSPPIITLKNGKTSKTKTFGSIDDTANAPRDEGFSHEKFGMKLLEIRPDLVDALGRFNKNNEIGKIFTKAHIDTYKYSQFITGTFDADRIDFLLRDSLAAGVSYGNIDLKYLLDNINYEKDSDQFYVDFNGIHALEHFITSRYFLYNITFHKTVMGFELMAKHAYYRMIKDKSIKIVSSEADLKKIVADDVRFICFNDDYFWGKLLEWKPRAKVEKTIKEALLFRIPLVELFTDRILSDKSKNAQLAYGLLDGKIYSNGDFNKKLSTFKIKRNNLALLENKIKFEELAPFTPHGEEPDPEKEWALCRVFYNNKVCKLIDIDTSIISRLSLSDLFIKRLFYLPLSKYRPNRDKFRKEMLKLVK